MRAGEGGRSLRAATADGLGASRGREHRVIPSPGAAPVLPAERPREQRALGFRGARAPRGLSWTLCSGRHSSGCRGRCRSLWTEEPTKAQGRGTPHPWPGF